jgi:hypothetical protein
MTMAVNVSAVQFRHPNLPGLVSRILAEEGVLPACLELELTEGVASNDPERAIAIMADLRARGVRMSIDDFGTGYSSLSYLKRFQVYKLKIDKSFVQDITVDAEDLAIVNAIISMASSLGLHTIAEGVETQEQLDVLRAKGCGEIQGYFFSKPAARAGMRTVPARTPPCGGASGCLKTHSGGGLQAGLALVFHAGKVKVHFRHAAAHDVGQRLARAAGMRPAQRAVAGVEEQVVQFRAADQRHIAGRGGAQAGPELRLARVARTGKELLHAAHDGLAAHLVQVAVVAVELGRARNAQAVAAASLV